MNIQLPVPALLGPSLPEPPAAKATASPDGETFHQALALASAKPKPDKVTDVAKQFEALMIGQVLKAARESSDGGWLSDGDDQTGDLTLELGEQSLSQAMASRGTFGIAKLVTDSLKRHDSTTASSGPATAHSPSMDSAR